MQPSNFFRDIVGSCYDMEYYRGVRTRPLALAAKYFVKLCALAAVAAMLLSIPAAALALRETRGFVHVRIPDGASFTVKGGRLSTTAATPLALGTGAAPFTIDPSVTGTKFPPAFTTGAGVLVGRDAVFVQRDKADRTVYALADSPDFTVAKPQIESWLGRFGALTVALFLLGLAVLLFVGPFLGGAAYAAFTSLLLLGVARIWKTRISYAQLFAMGLHALTLPGLLRYFFSSFRGASPFVFTVVYFMIMVAALSDERARPTAPLPSNA